MIDTIVTTAIGVIVTGTLGAIALGAKKILKSMDRFDKNMNLMLASDAVKAENIVKLLEVQRYIIKATRSHSYAFRELGANGSVTKALGHIDRAEDALNGRASDNAHAAMVADCEELLGAP